MVLTKQKGKVFLVGAGPGDPKLLTLKGKDCLEQADVVLYDHLANPVLLQYAPPQAERMYVGRRGRGQYAHQKEINQLLISKAREGNCVVRLKGGDPFVFGRGGEEAEVIAEAGLPFEIVPGVTSAVAVPAYAGIPVTHRIFASTVSFVTGHEDPTKGDSALEWPRLASSEGTLVFLMGMKNLPDIVQRLVAEGKPRETPVAVIRWGTYARQRTVVGTLENIIEKSKAQAMEPPSVIIIGRVVTLREKLNWFETRPLFGQCILVTRPRDQAPEFSNMLTAYGAEVFECPMLEIVPPQDWKSLDTAIRELPTFQWLIFTSVNGVRFFMKRLDSHGSDVRSLAGMKVCCIGPKTAEVAKQYGLRADLLPSTFQAEGLIEVMKQAGVSGKRILIPRAEVAREILPDQLKAMGADVIVVPAYRALTPHVDVERLRERFLKGEIHILTFGSSSTVRNFCRLFEKRAAFTTLMEKVMVACIGPITAKTAREEGLSVRVVAPENTMDSLTEAIVRHVRGAAA